MTLLQRTGVCVVIVLTAACSPRNSGPEEVKTTGPAPERAADPPRQAGAENTRKVTINGVRLSDSELVQIEQTYRVQILDADYWYDRISGAWGIIGGPMRGLVLPGLDLGGPLAPNASGGGTHVFINGRELHPLDVSGLRRCMNPEIGRWWVMADGTGGREGGPPFFNLYALCGNGAGGGRQGWLCDGGSCGTDRTVTGASGVVSEGNGQAGVYTSSGLILTPN